MKRKKEKINNTIINNLYKETIETTPEDGFVNAKEINPLKIQHYGKGNTQYRKGYAKTIVYTTDDPRITRPFAYSMCVIFFVIGIFLLLIGNFGFGIIFFVLAIFAFVKSKENIDKTAKKLKAKGQDVTIDSVEEKEQLNEEMVGIFKDSLKDVTSSTFMKDRFKWFVKTIIPIYCVMAIILSLLLGALINVFLGLFVFVILIICGLLYYFILSKIFKH